MGGTTSVCYHRRRSSAQSIDRVYSHIANNSPAMSFISDYYRTNQPFVRAQKETVSVEVRSVLPTSERTIEIEWVETTRDLYGSGQVNGALERHVHDRDQPALR